jgi:hypothetical protein
VSGVEEVGEALFDILHLMVALRSVLLFCFWVSLAWPTHMKNLVACEELIKRLAGDAVKVSGA